MGWRARARREAIAAIEDIVAAGSCVEVGIRGELETGLVGENREHRMMLLGHVIYPLLLG